MSPASTIKHSKTDVLIIGAGPAGLMCATWLARCGIPFRIIDKRPNKVTLGHADGLQCRSLEIFKSFSESSFNFTTLDNAWKVANHMTEMCFWSPNKKGELVRNSRVPDTIPGISNFTQCVIHQGYIEGWFNDSIKHFSGGKIEVERPHLPVSICINEEEVENQDSYPIQVMIMNLGKDELLNSEFGSKVVNGDTSQLNGYQEKIDCNIQDEQYEIIDAKYVIGADGAHSWVRNQLDIELEGQQTDFVWGVLDMVPLTNFPDIRSSCAIHSANSGSIMIIPRENDLVRFYIQLNEVERDPNNKSVTREFINDEPGKTKVTMERSEITPQLILKQAQEIMKPYTLEMTDLDWFTGYQIGQRVVSNYTKHNRVFLTGDACHTHSPLAGQGMNVSMQDTYNLGFKLALVCKGLAKREILKTYESERLNIAHELISFDCKLSKMFSFKPTIPKANILDGADMNEFLQVYREGNKFASGTIVDYEDSILIKKNGTFQDGFTVHKLASKIPIGRRLHSELIISQADARPVHIADRMASDGRFRLLIFPGDVNEFPQNMETLHEFQEWLKRKDFFAMKFTPINAFYDSVFDIITIHGSIRNDVEFYNFPEFTRPKDYKGRCNYWRLYSGVGKTYHEGEVNTYEKYGIDKKNGAIIVIRPDSHVSVVTEFNTSGLDQINQYFKEFMIPQDKVVLPVKSPKTDDKKRFIQPRLAA